MPDFGVDGYWMKWGSLFGELHIIYFLTHRTCYELFYILAYMGPVNLADTFSYVLSRPRCPPVRNVCIDLLPVPLWQLSKIRFRSFTSFTTNLRLGAALVLPVV